MCSPLGLRRRRSSGQLAGLRNVDRRIRRDRRAGRACARATRAPHARPRRGESPAAARTRPAMSPSTNGALVTRTSTPGRSISSSASSALRTAEPRSTSTSTPSGEATSAIAARPAVASVPSRSVVDAGRDRDLAAPRRAPSPSASSTAARASCGLCETTTMPITRTPLRKSLRERLEQQRRGCGTRVDVADAALAEVAGPALAGDQSRPSHPAPPPPRRRRARAAAARRRRAEVRRGTP